MNADEIRHMLSRIGYKPYWRFQYDGCARCVMVSLDVPDSYDHSRQAAWMGVPLSVPDDLTEETFPEWLLDHIYYIERHEMREFFTLDGEHIFNPHPELSLPDFERVRCAIVTRGKIQELQAHLEKLESGLRQEVF